MRLNMATALGKAERSKLSDAELKEVIYRIEHLTDKPNLEYLLWILGASKRFEYKNVLEKFIIYPENSTIAVTALSILCDDWGMAKQYSSYIKMIMRGCDWDTDSGYLRSIAISKGSYYFQEIEDKEILKILLAIFENDNEDISDRREAYAGILRCLGCFSPADIHIFNISSKPLEEDVDPQILKEAYKLSNKR